MKKAIVKSYGNKGEKIVNMNNAAVDKGSEVIKIDVPKEWAKLTVKPKEDDEESS
jgi:pyruvate-ferredoxin/flavodoxin oxidoreductase